MKTKTITYDFKKNLGNYETSYLEITVELEDGETANDAFIKVRDGVHKLLDRTEKPAPVQTPF